MKNTLKNLMVASSLLLLAGQSYAWVSVGFGYRGGWHGHYNGYVGIAPVWPYYPVAYPGPVVYEQPIIQQQPVVYQQPYATAAPQQPIAPAPSGMVPDPQALQTPNSIDYGQALASIHDRLAQERNLLTNQLAKGGLRQSQYDRDKSSLDRIAREEHGWAVGNNGSLSVAQINNLELKLEQAEQQIQQDLSE